MIFCKGHTIPAAFKFIFLCEVGHKVDEMIISFSVLWFSDAFWKNHTFSNKASSFSKREEGRTWQLIRVIKPYYSFYIKPTWQNLYATIKEKRKRNHDPSLQGATILLKLDLLSLIALCHLHLHIHFWNIIFISNFKLGS